MPLIGLRSYHDKRTFEDATTSLPTNKDVTTWRGNLSWLPTDDLTMFVTVATGFRAGIVQSQVQVQSLQQAGVPASIALDPETVEELRGRPEMAHPGQGARRSA